MDRQPVESSNIKSIGYDTGTLEIEFKSGGVYQYANVPLFHHVALMNTKSKGKYFHRFIKPNFEYQKVKD